MIHSLNGTQFNGIQAQWTDQTAGRDSNQTRRLSTWPMLVWSCPMMLKTEWLSLQALQTGVITELQTTDYADRAAQGTYTDVEIGVVSGDQRGHRMENCRVEFRVKV